MKIKPLGDRILLKTLEAKEQTKGGIVLPDTAKEKPQEAEVVEVGEGKRNKEGKIVPMSLKVGNKVLYAKYSGTEISVEGEEYIIVKEDDVLAIVE
ncbi:MAG: co-chaperone GroES [Candidatus Omnitrophica bacterium]|nr:co-chaperone GroES [Candidatus Omnitrophota bacterium]